MTLYSKRGDSPTELPFSDLDDLGQTWTNLQDNLEGREACGWALAPDRPPYDSTSTLGWKSGAWVISPKSPEALQADLEAARAAATAQALAIRQAREEGGVTLLEGPVATTSDAQRLIGGAATAAVACGLFNIPFAPISWTMADGSEVILNAQAVVTIGLKVVAHVNDCRKAYSAILKSLEEATTIAEIASIDLNDGYPT